MALLPSYRLPTIRRSILRSPGTGTAQGQLSVSPTSLSFGNVVVGANGSLNGTLGATGSSVTISAASINSNEFALSGISLPTTLSAGQTTSFTVTFKPAASGAASATLSFSSDAANSTAAQTLTGNGAAASQHSVALSWTASASYRRGRLQHLSRQRVGRPVRADQFCPGGRHRIHGLQRHRWSDLLLRHHGYRGEWQRERLLESDPGCDSHPVSIASTDQELFRSKESAVGVASRRFRLVALARLGSDNEIVSLPWWAIRSACGQRTGQGHWLQCCPHEGHGRLRSRGTELIFGRSSSRNRGAGCGRYNRPPSA